MSGGNDKLERELESFLSDDSRVAALYRRLPKDEPDAKLDAVILAQARVAVAPRRARPRWLPAMSAAAAIVIAAGLAYRVGPQVWSERSAVSEKAEQRVAAPAPVAAESAKSAAPPAPQAETSAPESLRTETVPSNPIPKQETLRDVRADADKLQSQKRKAEEQKTTTNAFAKQAVEGKLRSQDESAIDRANTANAPSGASREQPQRMKPLASPQRLDAAPAPPAETRSAAPAPLAIPTAKPSAPEPTAVPSAAGAAAAAPSAARAPARESAQSAADIEVTLYPEHWIADIQQMLKNGRRDDAIRNLKSFRKHYPDYTLPDDLRDLK
jgi:hypothetical protein